MTPSAPNFQVPPGILPFDLCTLTPQGIDSVIFHLRSHPLLGDVSESRLRAMAISFLAHGGINDGNHALPRGALHTAHLENHETGQPPWLSSLRDEYIQLVMDVVRLD